MDVIAGKLSGDRLLSASSTHGSLASPPACPVRFRLWTFVLFQDDGKTYAYEKGGGSITNLTWDDAAHQLKHEGASAWTRPDQSVVTVVGKPIP